MPTKDLKLGYILSFLLPTLFQITPKKGVSWDVSMGNPTTSAKLVKTSSLPAIKKAKFGHERKFGNVHPAVERELLKMDLEEKLKRAEKNRKKQMEERCEKLHKRNQDVMAFVNDLRFIENEVP